MGDKKFQELILDAIDQLRKRKARPDLDRICHMLGRRHGLKAPEVNDELVRLVKEGVVIKVDYKGNTSYRNAAKWVRTKSALVGSVCNYSEATSVVLTIVDALCFPTNNEAGAEPRGVSLQEIEAHLLKREAQTNINSTTLRAVLEKAVASGLLKKLSSGEFITHTVRNVPDITKTTTEPFDDPKVEKNKIGRPASTRKRFKKTHGPDFLDTTSILSSDSPGQIRCDYCLLTANANINGEPEDLLVCKDCNAKAHPSCMDYTVELAARSQMSPWQCTDCKTCTICEDSGDGDLMLFCDLCDKGFHMNCHVPPVTTKPTGKWVCSYCHKDEPNNVKKEVKQPTSKKVTNSVNRVHSPSLEEAINDLKGKKLMFVCDERLKRYPDVVPCAKNWSIEDVETFFQFIGYKEEAPAFREQEIDGQSLLLMKRNDVLTGLALKLGPALKIYNHIKRLQSKVSNGYNL